MTSMARRGGGGVLLAAKTEDEGVSPERLRDLDVLRRALEVLSCRHAAACARQGRPDPGTFRLMNIVRDLNRDVRRSRHGRLSERQLSMLAGVLGEDVPRVPAAPPPPGLAFLPRKPPGHPDYGPKEGA